MFFVEPSIKVIFHQAIDPDTDQPIPIEEYLERCGRICYKSEDRITATSAEEFIRMIEKRGHHSVLEHCIAAAHFVCNRGVTHELVRHRIASYSQESTRYCNYGKDKFAGQIKLIPMLGGLTEEQLRRRQELYILIEEVYLAEVREGVKPQQARDNLPICLKTEIIATFNLREWMHVFTLRCSKAAHPQIRELMLFALDVFAEKIPTIFAPLRRHIVGAD